MAGAIAGTASRLAGTATRLTVPESAGDHRRAGHLRGRRDGQRLGQPGRPAPRAAARPASAGASSSRPAGGQHRQRETRRRPASSGSTTTSTATAGGQRGQRRPGPTGGQRRAGRSPPIAAARTTLGDGRARITKPTSATAQTSAASHGPARHHRASEQHQRRRRSPRWLPTTAIRWVMPVVRKSSSTAGSSRLVSPTTRPGSRPPGSAGSGAQARCSPARSAPAARWTHGGRRRSTGARSVESTAARRSPPRGGSSRPVAVTRCPGSRPRQPGSLPSTSTGTRIRTAPSSAAEPVSPASRMRSARTT